jgi:transposase-like protein
MWFWGWDWRFGRRPGVRIWIRRAYCPRCELSRTLLPSFLLERRLDPVSVIGAALAAMANGQGMRPVAAAFGVPHETVRGWRRRYRARAPTLVAGFVALAVGLGAVVTELSGEPERAGLEALAMAWTQARRRLGERVVGLFEFASLVSGGELLSTNTSPPWAGLGGAALMPPVAVSPSQRSSS